MIQCKEWQQLFAMDLHNRAIRDYQPKNHINKKQTILQSFSLCKKALGFARNSSKLTENLSYVLLDTLTNVVR